MLPISTCNDPRHLAHFFMAIRIDTFQDPAVFKTKLQQLVDELRAEPPADVGQPVMVAGDKELACRETRLEQGIPLSHSVADELDGLLDRFELNQVPRLLSGS